MKDNKLKDELKKGKVAATLLAEHLNRMNSTNCNHEITIKKIKYYVIASIKKPILPTKELAGIISIAEMALYNANRRGYMEGIRKAFK